jgi:outer membrane protein assembly factor BamB
VRKAILVPPNPTEVNALTYERRYTRMGSRIVVIVSCSAIVTGCLLSPTRASEFHEEQGTPSLMHDGEIGIHLTPEETSIPRGERLRYDLAVLNFTGDPVSVQVWTGVTMPNGKPYPGNPVLGPKQVTIPGLDSLYRSFDHLVPGKAPLGEYLYWCHAGTYPHTVVAADTFVFEVVSQYPKLLWEVDLSAPSFGGGAVGDIDEDGKPEVVFGTYFGDGHLYAVNGEDGSILWKFSGWDGPWDASCAIYDVDQDGSPEIVAADSWGRLYCLNGQGNIEWQFSSAGCTDSPPAIEDIDSDGKPEVIFGAWSGWLYVLNGENGSVCWSVNYGSINYIQSQPGVVDVDGDEQLDIVFGTWGDNYIYAVSGTDGSILWTYPTNDYIYHGPSFADIDEDGKPELVCGGYDGYVRALNAEDGSLLWSYREGSYPYAPVSIADLNNDGHLEVVAASSKLVVLNNQGHLLWQYYTGGSIFRGATIADTDGDGWLDLVFGSGDGRMRVVRGYDGVLLWDYYTEHGYDIDHHPAIADLNGDGKLDVFFVGGNYDSEEGKAYAIAAGDGNGGGWPMFLHDLRHSGNFHGW